MVDNESCLHFTSAFQAKLKRFFGPYRTTLKIGESEILDHAAGVQYLSIGQYAESSSCIYICIELEITFEYVVLIHESYRQFNTSSRQA